MNLQTVLNQYSNHGVRIIQKALGRPMTGKELKGLAYYMSAYETVKFFLEQGPLPTEGFVMREYIPQHLRFASPKETANEQ